jgi:hypothetical protein
MTTARTTKDIYAELDFLSDRLSTQIRTLALGVLAIVWLFLAGLKDSPALRLASSTRPLVGIGLLCIIGILFDYLQYLFGYWATLDAKKSAEASTTKTASYDYDDWRWRARMWCFRLKQVVTVGASVWLLTLILAAVL